MFCHLHNACTTKFIKIEKRTRFFGLPVVQILPVGCAKEFPEDKGTKFLSERRRRSWHWPSQDSHAKRARPSHRFALNQFFSRASTRINRPHRFAAGPQVLVRYRSRKSRYSCPRVDRPSAGQRQHSLLRRLLFHPINRI